jgi:carbonic anhydrase
MGKCKRLQEDPEYFTNLAKGQSPEVLWIGCSDSRVPANEVTGTKPGEVFVHRNIANVCNHTDMNMLSVLDYAVNVLKVKHVIVAGHYGCGGVAAALTNKQFGIIDNWLRHIKDVYRLHSNELDRITDKPKRLTAWWN